jgi:hypothetical protein
MPSTLEYYEGVNRLAQRSIPAFLAFFAMLFVPSLLASRAIWEMRAMWRGRPRPRYASGKATASWAIEFGANEFGTNEFGTNGSRTNFFYGFCFLLFLASIAPCAAQRGGVASGGHAPGPAHSPSHSAGHSSAFGRSVNSRRSPYLSPYASLPFPFFGDAFDAADLYSSGYPVASELPPSVLQAASAMAGPPVNFMGARSQFDARSSSPSQPLLIELQNGHYVKVDSAAIDGEARDLIPGPAENAQAASPPARHSAIALAANSGGPLLSSGSPAPALPPAILFFRDGHSEEVRDYTIAAGFLYARGNYYTDGYWNKKIDLSALNVTRTLQANAEHNVNFVLPSSANEVITRP